jgi:hypothetical protein
MAGKAPEISVVIPVYNSARYLAETIESTLSQSFTDWELVAVDDGSTDASGEILAEYAAADPRVVVHRQENAGVGAALNKGLELARAPLVARLDADDLSLPGRLERQHRFLRDHPEVGMVGGQAAIIDLDGREVAEARYPLDDAAIREQLKRTTAFIHSSVMIRRSVLDRTGGYRSPFDGAEDLDLWLRVAACTQLAHLPEKVVAYRIHPDQASNKIELQAVRILAGRESARRREQGLDDSFRDLVPIDEATLLSLGVSRAQVDEEVVNSSVWLAKTADRAGYHDNSRELFAVAWRRARAAENRHRLAATIRRAEQKRHQEQGHVVRGRLKGLAAAAAERRG